MRHAAAIALIMSLPLSAAMADVYRSVDPQGHVQYSDTPTPGAELVHVQKQGIPGGLSAPSSAVSSAAAPKATNTAATTTSPPTLAKAEAHVQDQLAQQAAQKAVAQDVEQSRADQCKKATDDYDNAVRARRIYKTGADGEREYLSDADVEQQRMNLRLAMQAACGGSQ